MNEEKIVMVICGIVTALTTAAFGALCYYTGESEMLEMCIEEGQKTDKEVVASDK